MGIYKDLLDAKKGDSLLPIYEKQKNMSELVFYDTICLAGTLGLGNTDEVEKIFAKYKNIERGTLKEAYFVSSYTGFKNIKKYPTTKELVNLWKRFVRFESSVDVSIKTTKDYIIIDLEAKNGKKLDINDVRVLDLSYVHIMPETYLKTTKKFSFNLVKNQECSLVDITKVCMPYSISNKKCSVRVHRALLASSISISVSGKKERYLQIHTLWQMVVMVEKGDAIKRIAKFPEEYIGIEKYQKSML